MLSSFPSQIQQEIEFIRPMIEERFAKMKEYGEDWDDKPVCQTIFSGVSLISWLTRRTIYSCGLWARLRESRGPLKAWRSDCFSSILQVFIQRPWQVLTSRCSWKCGPNLCTSVDAHTGIVPTSCESWIYRTPAWRGRHSDYGRGLDVDESWNRQDAQIGRASCRERV